MPALRVQTTASRVAIRLPRCDRSRLEPRDAHAPEVRLVTAPRPPKDAGRRHPEAITTNSGGTRPPIPPQTGYRVSKVPTRDPKDAGRDAVIDAAIAWERAEDGAAAHAAGVVLAEAVRAFLLVEIGTVLHFKSQDGQPYGSERRCCSECGARLWVLSDGEWTDVRAEWETPRDGYVNCRDWKKRQEARPTRGRGGR
jgi:hypothetical protein